MAFAASLPFHISLNDLSVHGTLYLLMSDADVALPCRVFGAISQVDADLAGHAAAPPSMHASESYVRIAYSIIGLPQLDHAPSGTLWTRSSPQIATCGIDCSPIHPLRPWQTTRPRLMATDITLWCTRRSSGNAVVLNVLKQDRLFLINYVRYVLGRLRKAPFEAIRAAAENDQLKRNIGYVDAHTQILRRDLGMSEAEIANAKSHTDVERFCAFLDGCLRDDGWVRCV